MTTMADTIVAKSDQLNSDDLMGRSITIKITDVKVMMAEQPCIISYEGDGGKPYKPGKSMRRVIVQVWGADPAVYVGRSLTLYRDAEVMFGGVKVGGTRISHMSHIDRPVTMALTATRGNKKPFTVQPLKPTAAAPAEVDVPELQKQGRDEAMQGTDALKAWWTGIGGAAQKAIGGAAFLAELKLIASPPQTTSGDDEETQFDV
jgi:hypothetical protein